MGLTQLSQKYDVVFNSFLFVFPTPSNLSASPVDSTSPNNSSPVCSVSTITTLGQATIVSPLGNNNDPLSGHTIPTTPYNALSRDQILKILKVGVRSQDFVQSAIGAIEENMK